MEMLITRVRLLLVMAVAILRNIASAQTADIDGTAGGRASDQALVIQAVDLWRQTLAKFAVDVV
jgi:hypothetical protein